MRFLKCPICDHTAARLWEIFVFPSPLWLYRSCRHCGGRLRFNREVFSALLRRAFGAMLAFVIVGYVARAILRLEISAWIDWTFLVGLVIYVLYPLVRGEALFSEKEKLK